MVSNGRSCGLGGGGVSDGRPGDGEGAVFRAM